MIILFDLDDTLLENSMENFLPAYFHLLGNSLSEFTSPTNLPKFILAGTDMMVNNLDPETTLEECFDNYFYPKLGIEKQSTKQKIKHFYEYVFPELRSVTKEIDSAAETIKTLLLAGHKIVIATNPLFPKKAIDHRIEWANLGVPLSSFSYITNYEELHFTKPRSEFLLEVIGKIGWPDEPIVMVGNEWEMDIEPAEKIGIPSFFIGTPPMETNYGIHHLSSSGQMNQVLDWIKNLESLKTFELSNSKNSILASLRATAANIDSYRRVGISYDHFSTQPALHEWSLVEIISHLADVDGEVNIPRLLLIQNQNYPFIEAALTDQWAEERNYIKNDPLESIKKFMKNRKTLLEIITDLKDEEWSKTINHAIFGPTKVSELLKFTTQHDRIHLAQLLNTLEIVKNS